MSRSDLVSSAPGVDLRKIQRLFGTGGPLVALVVLVAFFSLASSTFFTLGNGSSLLTQLSILLVVAIGLTFVIILGSLDLSIEGVMASSSLVFVLLAANDRNDSDLGFLAVIAGVLTGSLFGLLNGVLHVHLKIPSFMVTLGTGAIGIGIATVLFGGRAPRLMDDSLRDLGFGSLGGIPKLAIIAVIVLTIALLVQRFTRVGRYGYAIGGDEQVMKLSGVNINRYKVLSFVLTGTASGIAGVMAALQLGVGDVTIGGGYLFTAITAVVLGGTALVGGIGGVGRTLVGAAIITVLANGLILIGVNPYVQVAVQGLVIVLAVAVTGWSLRKRVRAIK
ncbi:ABC transporter permease [Microterricola pindariensis]|uniref:ABC transporter permease n=1 Tax=Microterricola pindariensis TaxID=478010 RepID=A0ABX5B1I8_9MICO|nr:ABC transporter permease [Microterricola pindariensis]